MGNWSRFSLRGAVLAFVGAMGVASNCSALNAVQTTGLNFGTIGITSNVGMFFIQVDKNSVVTSSPEILPITPATPATFSITGGPADTVLDIIGNSTVITPAFSSPRTFTLDFNLASPQAERTTDSSGNLTFVLGATLTTDGGGGSYGDGPYQGNYVLSINF